MYPVSKYEGRRRRDELDFRRVDDFFPRDAEALDREGLLRRYFADNAFKDFVRQEEFEAVRQEEEKAVRRVESRAVAHFVHAEGAADGNEGFLFRACKAEFFINIPNRRFVEDVRAHGEPGRVIGHGVLDGEGAAQDDEVGVLNVAEVVEDEIEVQEAVDHLIQMLHVFGILLQLVHVQSHADG